ncbi:hypothetical protein PybrP1_003848, partial [[Pythium] brassicae (nom. inval.)]
MVRADDVAAPAPLKKAANRGLRFNEKHVLKYGLSVCSRNALTASVEIVMCKFCVAFGKEAAPDRVGKRRVSANIKYFRQPFRADHYLSHLAINHRQKWSEYEQATDLEKEQFFAALGDDGAATAAVALAQTRHAKLPRLSSNGAGVASASDPQFSAPPVGPVRLPASEIESAVVEQLLGDVLFCPSDAESKRRALEVFAKKPNGNYEVAVRNQRLFDLAIKFVACGASFRLAARMVQCTKEETKLACYSGGSEHKLAGYVRALLASNLQKIALVMRASWAYTLATDAAEHQGTSYLGVRVRLWQRGALHDFHLLAVPAFDRVPAPAIVARIESCLDVLDAHWRAKLVGATANGGADTGRASGTTSSQQGLTARLARLATSPGFYLVWCGEQQLDLVVCNAVRNLGQQSFVDELVAMVGAVNHGHDGYFDGSPLPDITPTRLVAAFKWAIDHRAATVAYLQATMPSAVPSASWWVYVAVAHRVLAEVEHHLRKLRAPPAGPSGSAAADLQVQELVKLAMVLTDLAGIRRDLWEPRDADDACVAGSLALSFQNAHQFIQHEGGALGLEMFDTLRGVDRLHVSKAVARFVVELVASISTVAQEGRRYCTEKTSVLMSPPCVLPMGVCEMGRDQFAKLVATQERRLLHTLSSNDVKAILKEYEAFQYSVKREPILYGVLQKHTRETEVGFAWSSVSGRFRLLREFVGGLATVVPEAAASTFALDLSTLNWDKPDARQTMVDFALEGILHAKQKLKVELVDLDYPVAVGLSAVNASAGSPDTDNFSSAAGTPLATSEPPTSSASMSSDPSHPVSADTNANGGDGSSTAQVASLGRLLLLTSLCLAYGGAKEVFEGRATTYGLVKAIGGSCSARKAPNGVNELLFAAMNRQQYDDSASCSRCISVKGARGTVLAYVADYCYECGENNLDLNTALWNAAIGGDPRIEPISWSFTPCPDEKEKFCVKEGSNPHWFALQVTNSRDGIKSMEINGQSAQVIGIT